MENLLVKKDVFVRRKVENLRKIKILLDMSARKFVKNSIAIVCTLN